MVVEEVIVAARSRAARLASVQRVETRDTLLRSDVVVGNIAQGFGHFRGDLLVSVDCSQACHSSEGLSISLGSGLKLGRTDNVLIYFPFK